MVLIDRVGHSKSLLIKKDEKELQDTRGSRGKGGTERKEKSIIPRQIDQNTR
jgi:hypothetical protein